MRLVPRQHGRKRRQYPVNHHLAAQVLAIDRSFLTDRVGRLSRRQLDLVLAGIDIVLGR